MNLDQRTALKLINNYRVLIFQIGTIEKSETCATLQEREREMGMTPAPQP